MLFEGTKKLSDAQKRLEAFIVNNLTDKMKFSFINSPTTNDPGRHVPDDRWALILAGGDGSRLLPLTRKITGDERPKQFCPVIGSSTLLDETRRRVAHNLSPKKTMFVLTKKHDRYYEEALADVPRNNLVVQPRNAGTAPAILYSLLRLERVNPAASAAFFPSDHYFSDDEAFMSVVDSAFEAARSQADRIVLLGIEPEAPDEEYGWIEPDPVFSVGEVSRAWPVRRFWEKPSPALACELMDRGCLWNSFVMVGAVSAFLKMIRLALPELFARLAAVRSDLCTRREEEAMRIVYTALPDNNFSTDVLARRAKDLSVIRVGASKWSDLGSPHRVQSTLSVIGGSPLVEHDLIRSSALPEAIYEPSGVRGGQAV